MRGKMAETGEACCPRERPNDPRAGGRGWRRAGCAQPRRGQQGAARCTRSCPVQDKAGPRGVLTPAGTRKLGGADAYPLASTLRPCRSHASGLDAGG